MDSNKKLRGFMTKRGSKGDAPDIYLESSQKLGDAARRPLPYPRAAAEAFGAARREHRPSPRPRSATA